MIKIKNLATTPPRGVDKKSLEKETKKAAKKIGELHQQLIAQNDRNVLIILQGMDASGKDGAVKKVFRYCTHNNFSTHSFKKPTDLEFAHDFLWRVHQQVPAKGEIKIFNRSHYEDVLIQRVHGWIDEERVNARFEAINAFEKLLITDNNTVILKFFLNISYEQQEIELQQRIDDPKKNYKHNDGDWEERKFWSKYMSAYEDVLNRSEIPWHVIPVDKRWYRDYLMSKIIVQALSKD